MDEMELRGAPIAWSLKAAGARRLALLQLRADHSALRAEVAWLEFLLAFKAAFNPNQPRLPAGHPDGGQWTDGDGDGGVIPVADNDRPAGDIYLSKHALDNHVAKSDAELIARMQRKTRRRRFFSDIMDRNGSFESVENARGLIKRTIDMNPEAVARVANNRSKRELLTHRFGYPTGREAYRDPPDSEIIRLRPTYNVGVIIEHDPKSELGYRIINAFPRNFLARIGRRSQCGPRMNYSIFASAWARIPIRAGPSPRIGLSVH